MHNAVIEPDAPGWVDKGVQSVLLTGRDLPVRLYYRVDDAEDSRRHAAGIRSITDLAILDALLTLPEGLDVPMTSLAGREQRILSRLPPVGVLTQHEGRITRIARAPLQVVRAEVAVSRSWLAAFRRVREFSQYAERVLLSASPLDADALLEASYSGVGVAVGSDSGWDWQLEPAKFVVQEHSAARWSFAESIYELHLSRSQPRPATGKSATPAVLPTDGAPQVP
ncbi:hypothetical protein [Amycolatopsis sp. NPDC052450]|uniref:hypothetical protein n=1 Tax=Amycolatopsis sp. NPDC052450 TaxID=3363937 RepID=UPI0037C7DE7F